MGPLLQFKRHLSEMPTQWGSATNTPRHGEWDSKRPKTQRSSLLENPVVALTLGIGTLAILLCCLVALLVWFYCLFDVKQIEGVYARSAFPSTPASSPFDAPVGFELINVRDEL